MFKPEFYKNKKILLTGHTGFKGTWMSLMLEKLGAEVYGYALEKSENTPFYAQTAPKIAGSFLGFIQDRKCVKDYLCYVRPEIVIHFASHSTLNKSAEITDYIFDTNIIGVVNLLEAVRITNTVKTVLVVTSDKCYKNLESSSGYKEDSVLGAQDPYSTSKACQELLTECYHRSFFKRSKLNIPIATARASNVIGGGDYNLTRLFPYLLNCFSQNVTAEIRNPEAIRPWQNVLDVLGGYLTLIQKLYESENADSDYSSAFNFGPEPDGFATVKRAADLLCSQFSGADYKISGSLDNVIETKILKLDSTKAKKMLDWRPVYSFEDTVKMSAEFTKRQKSCESVRAIALDIINRYMEGVSNV